MPFHRIASPTPLAVLAVGLLAAGIATAARLRVTDAAGAPVAGARVTSGTIERLTDEHGSAEVPDADLASTCVVADGFAPSRPAADGVTRLAAGVAVVGRVSFPDGVPAPGIALSVPADDDLGPCARQGISDAKGAYRIPGLTPGLHALRVAPTESALVPAANPAVLIAGEQRRLDLRVHRAVRLPLTVTGSDGKPLPGARVRVLADWAVLRLDPGLAAEARKPIDTFDGLTDDQGGAMLPLLPVAGRFRVAVTQAAHAPGQVVLQEGFTGTPIALGLRPGGTLALRATDEAGTPLSGAQVRLTSKDALAVDLVPARPPGDATGIVRIGRLPEGRYNVEVRALAARPKLVRGITITDGRSTDLGDVALSPGVTVLGTVLVEGAPFPDATVALVTYAEGARLRLEAKSDAEGRFAFDGLDPDASAELRAEADGYLAASAKDIEPGAAAITLELRRAGSLVVHVVDGSSEEPLVDPRVRLGQKGHWDVKEPTQDEGSPGTWSFDPLAPGTYEVVATASGRAPARTEALEIRAGEKAEVTLSLEAGRSLSGRVVDAVTSRPVALAVISADSPGPSTRSQDDGTFVLDGLEGTEGTVRVRVEHPSYQPAAPQDVDPDELPPEGFVAALQPGCTIEGAAYGPDGRPLPGALVRDVEAERSVVTDTQGRYRLEGLPSGARSLMKVDRPSTIDGYETAVVTTTPERPGLHDWGRKGRLTGRITSDGEPAPNARLSLVKVPVADDFKGAFRPSIASAAADDEGAYTITGLERGLHSATIRWQGRTTGRDVEILGGEQQLDFEVPDIVVAGRVLDAETQEPLPDAEVMIVPEGSANRPSIAMGIGPDPMEASAAADTGIRQVSLGNFLLVRSDSAASASSGADGSFNVRLGAMGPHVASVFLEGYESTGRDLEVTASRTDVVFLLTPEIQGEFRVTLVDSVNGRPMTGTVVVAGPRGAVTHTASTTPTTGTLDTEGPFVVAGWVEGRALAVQGNLQPAEDGDLEVSLPMRPGGALRLLVPEGTFEAERPLDPTGPVSLRLGSGFELTGTANAFGPSFLRQAVDVTGPGEIVVSDLPEGALTVQIGQDAPRTIDIVAGQVVEVDLR